MSIRRVTALEYSIEQSCSVPQARRLLREKGCKEIRIRRRKKLGFNTSRWQPMLVFELEEGEA